MAAVSQKSDDESLTPMEQFPKLQTIVDQWTHCADCNQANPKWAEISRGILICLQCSGVHRQLGTHISKVRSLTLDKWTQTMVDNMCANDTEFNRVWEYHVDPAFMKPTSKTKRSVRSKYIKAKYRQSMFHEDNHKRLAPKFASAEYDESEDEKDAEEDAASGPKKRRKSTVGMVAYTGVIKIHCISAKQLPKADLLSDSDPYVVFSNRNGQAIRSKTVDNNNDPVWNQHLILSVNEHEPITITIFDEDDHSSDDLLCSATLDIARKCKEGEEVKFQQYAMNVEERWQKQKKKSTLTFSVIYEKMDAQ